MADKEMTKRLAEGSRNFQLHVSLLRRIHPDWTPSMCVGGAYTSGPGGLNALIPTPTTEPAKPEATK